MLSPALIEICIELWRLKREDKELAEGNLEKGRRGVSRCTRRLESLLDELGFVIRDPLNEEFVDGSLEMKVVAVEERPGLQPGTEVVVETVRPVVHCGGTLVARAEVVVAAAPKPSGVGEERKE